MHPTDASKWDQITYRRRIETFGVDDGPAIAAGPKGEFDAVWYYHSQSSQAKHFLIKTHQPTRGIDRQRPRNNPRTGSTSPPSLCRPTQLHAKTHCRQRHDIPTRNTNSTCPRISATNILGILPSNCPHSFIPTTNNLDSHTRR